VISGGRELSLSIVTIFRARIVCSPGRRLIDPEGLTVSPDGVNVYSASFLSGALGTFDRDRNNGALTQKPGSAGCIASTAKGDCTSGRGGMHGVSSVVVSADGKYLYAVANVSNSLTVFKRLTR
jgi:DNA-binding beta-propeller fold protein YncE